MKEHYYWDFVNKTTGEVITVISTDIASAIQHLKNFYGVDTDWMWLDVTTL